MTWARFFRVFMVVGSLLLAVASSLRNGAAAGKVYLLDNQDVRYEIADISLIPDGGGNKYQLRQL